LYIFHRFSWIKNKFLKIGLIRKPWIPCFETIIYFQFIFAILWFFFKLNKVFFLIYGYFDSILWFIVFFEWVLVIKTFIDYNLFRYASHQKCPHLEREVIETIQSKRVIGLTEEIPFDWHCLLNAFSKVFNDQLMWQISNFMRDLPKGFPVLIECTQTSTIFQMQIEFIWNLGRYRQFPIFGTIWLSNNSRFSGSYTTRK
jgi:hypothetical protein